MNNVLFISPVMPCSNGSGRQQRAYQWIHLLAATNKVHLLVVNVKGCGLDEIRSGMSLPTASCCICHAPYSKWKSLIKLPGQLMSIAFGNGSGGSEILQWISCNSQHKLLLKNYYGSQQFAKVVCFRLYLSEFALYIAGISKISSLELDLDDLEPETQRKLAFLAFKNGKLLKGIRFALAAFQFSRFERAYLKKFNQIYVCSKEDQQKLEKKYPGIDPTVLPNRVPASQRMSLRWKINNAYHILFVGTLGYYPNEQAIRWFVDNVLSGLRRDSHRWTFMVVGYRPSKKLASWLSKKKGVLMLGEVKDLTPIYAEAGIIVSPLQAGGGTKLKVIEGMKQGRPLVATDESVCGLEMIPDIHYLKANTAAEFIKQCLRLARDPGLARQLTKAGQQLVGEKYTYSEINEIKNYHGKNQHHHSYLQSG